MIAPASRSNDAPASRSLTDNETVERVLAQDEKCRTCGLFLSERVRCSSTLSQEHRHPDGSTSLWLDSYLCEDSQHFRPRSASFKLDRVSASLTCLGYQRRGQ